MAEKKVKTVEFDLFPSRSTVDDDLPPDQAELKAALFGDRPLEPEDVQHGKSPVGPSVTTFPKIRADYLADKVSAVKQSIAPYHNPENLAKEFGDMPIEELLDWTDARSERIESMWEDPEYAFIRLVEGAAIDNTLGMRQSMPPQGVIPRPSLPVPRSDRDRIYAPAPRVPHSVGVRGGATGNDFGVAEDVSEMAREGRAGPLLPGRAAPPPAPQPKQEFAEDRPDPGLIAGARVIGKVEREAPGVRPGIPEAPGFVERVEGPEGVAERDRGAPAFEVWRDEKRERERVDILRTVRREAQRPEVSGRMQMSAQLQAAVGKSLSDLTQYNFDKFSGKTKEDFFKDSTAMSLLAQLTAANVALAKVRAPKTYYKDQDNARRLVEIRRFTQQIDSDLMWDPRQRAFVLATPDVRRQNMRRRSLPPTMRRTQYGLFRR